MVDCEGDVAAVASSIVTQGSLYFAGREIRLTTPWGMANKPPHGSNLMFDHAVVISERRSVDEGISPKTVR
jgi:hypothetical protein